MAVAREVTSAKLRINTPERIHKTEELLERAFRERDFITEVILGNLVEVVYILTFADINLLCKEMVERNLMTTAQSEAICKSTHERTQKANELWIFFTRHGIRFLEEFIEICYTKAPEVYNILAKIFHVTWTFQRMDDGNSKKTTRRREREEEEK